MATHALQRMAAQLVASSANTACIVQLRAFIDVMQECDIELWVAQNAYNVVWQRDYDAISTQAHRGDTGAQTWVDEFRLLGMQLNMAMERGVG